MVDEAVRKAEAQHARARGEAVDHARDLGAGAADHRAFLQGHDELVAGGELGDQLGVERLDEAHVGQGGVERLGDFARHPKQAAEGEQGDAAAVAHDLPLADRQGAHLRLRHGTVATTARVAHRARAGVLHRGVEHLAALVLVGGRHHHQVGDTGQEGEVEGAVVGRAVGAHQAAAVDREHDRKVLQRDVVDELVVGALQEGRVDRHHRHEAFAGQACGEGHRVLLGDADVEVTLGELLREAHQAGALAHCRGDADDAWVGLGHVAQPVAEHLGVGELATALAGLDAGGVIELGDAVVEHRVGLGELVALALAGDHVEELRPLELAEVLQRGDERVEVVAVDRAVVMKAELLEQRAWPDHALGVLLDLAREFGHWRRHAQHLLADTARGVVGRARHHAGEDLGERPDRWRDRHLVVVEDHQQVEVLHVAGVVERLEGHAGRHRAVTDHRDRVAVLGTRARRDRHAERR